MSAESGSNAGDRTVDFDVGRTIDAGTFRLLACGCVLVLTASYVSVLREVTRVVGGTQSLLVLVASMLVAATIFAWAIRPRTATVAAITAGVFGFAYYLEISGVGAEAMLSASDAILSDTLSLVVGLPLLRMVAADVWTLAFVPAPVFLSWYLAVRGRYALSVVPGGFALAFLVLTGDAGTTITLLGTMAAIGAIGFGELERRDGSVAQADLLAVLFALIIVLSLSVSFIPGDMGTSSRVSGNDPGTLEGTIDSSSERSAIGGPVELSPEVRFTVESEQPSYWRTGVYDRFTGDEWVRTGEPRDYDGSIQGPPGDADRFRQTITAETDLGVLPTAPQPVAIEGDFARHAEVSRHGQVHPTTPVLEGDTYAVESASIDPSPRELRDAGTDYPESVTDDYLQTPEGVSSEFESRTAEITADADTPYEKAAAIESHLRTSKGYSLDAARPDGNVAEEFLLEMDEGYCVYFATTMTQMLRAEDVPARYVTGYTSGQQVDDDEYVVRGTDAHAWVEVYFPDHGWVAFEPTPGDSRDTVHSERVEQAREDGVENVDTDASEDVPVSDEDDPDDGNGTPSDPANGVDDPADEEPSDPANEEPSDPANGSNGNNGTESNGSEPSDPGDGSESVEADDDDWSSYLALLAVSREVATLGLIALVGVVAGVHRTSLTARARRELGLYWQRPGNDPDRDVRRAYRRLERLLAREYRPRDRGESARQYIGALASDPDRSVDPRARTVADRYERATYAGGVSRANADEAIEMVDELARERLPMVGRGRR
ncbi:transglutaminase domain-containing protein [Natronorubrum halophilum]|uniref:transglutaminase domain-containing protein n=1 Tax=Natronorubrum halophilum TaxID=1702106 RepID=UPI000EF66869|nr:transglutaminaseTgpA domain-containing protein [Natronorubrum halophilum]